MPNNQSATGDVRYQYKEFPPYTKLNQANEIIDLHGHGTYGAVLDSDTVNHAQVSILRVYPHETPDNSVTINGGTYMRADGTGSVTITSTQDSPVFVPEPSGRRVDLLCMGNSGTPSILQGVSDPLLRIVPTYPSDLYVLAEIDITEASGVQVTEDDITDVRPLINLGGGSGGGSIEATTSQFEQTFTSQTSITVNHGLAQRPIVQVLDSSDKVIVPYDITVNGTTQVIVTLTQPRSGRVICTAGGTATAHSGLSGLLNDDHTQYLLVSGARSIAGNFTPDSTGIRDLGSNLNRFRDLYLSEDILSGGNIDASGTISSDTMTTDNLTVNTSLSIPPDSIKDSYIDFGTGPGQVSTDDIIEGSNNKYRYILQRQRDTNNTYTTCSTNIPNNDTIPQQTEGTEILSQAITPGSASHKLYIRATIYANSAGENIVVALFQDSVANALTVAVGHPAYFISDDITTISLDYEMTAGTTSPTTFKIRVGADSENVYVNGDDSGRVYGGTIISSLTIEETV